MKNQPLVSLLLLLLSTGLAYGHSATISDPTAKPENFIVLGTAKNYSQAVSLAKEISAKTGIKYDSQGMMNDPKRGLIWSDNYEQKDYAGGYRPRHEEETYISVEYAEDFLDKPSAPFVLIGAIESDKVKAQEILKSFKEFVPKSYVFQGWVSTYPAAENSTIDEHIIVLGVQDDYAQLVKHAKEISAKTGIKYDSEGMVYDKKRGLINPDNSDDDMYAGGYYPRRYDSRYISIERAEYYLKNPKGKYAIIGFMDMEPREANRILKWYRQYVPDVALSKAPFYMGCIH
jgi:hypothetical protein